MKVKMTSIDSYEALETSFFLAAIFVAKKIIFGLNLSLPMIEMKERLKVRVSWFLLAAPHISDDPLVGLG